MKGLTVVTGRSNIGKTALIRAVAAAFFGLPGDYYIRRGETFCGVVIEDEKLKLVWRKVNKPTPERQTALQVNGVVHTKLGKEHSELTKDLGVRGLQTSAAWLSPQIAMQPDPIFLLTETETTVAEVFKLLGRVDVITTAQQLAGRDKRDREATRKVREQDKVKATSDLEGTDYLPQWRQEFNLLRTGVEQVEQETVVKQGLIEDLKRVREFQPVAVEGVMSDPPDVELQWRVLETLEALKNLLGIRDQYDRELADTELAYTGLQDRKLLMETELGVCPVCQRPFD